MQKQRLPFNCDTFIKHQTLVAKLAQTTQKQVLLEVLMQTLHKYLLPKHKQTN